MQMDAHTGAVGMRFWITVLAVAGWLIGCPPGNSDDDKAGSSGSHARGHDQEDTGSSEGSAGKGGDAGSSDDEGDGKADAGAADDEEDLGNALTYYRDVKPIMDQKCAQCHFDGGIAPVPFTTYDEVAPFAKLIQNDVSKGIMPPWRAAGDLDYYVADRRLNPEQKDTIVRWVKQGAPKGKASQEPKHSPAAKRGLERVDLSLEMKEPYTPMIEPDDYRCFVLEWPFEDTKYITGLGIEPGNRKTVHHSILYLIPPDKAQDTRDQDAAEDGPGYTCFGTTGGQAAWLTSYEPGGYGEPVPGNLGFEIEPGSLLVLQIHYNTLNDKTSDQSHVELMLEDEVERVGQVSLIMNAQWPAGFMPIPANQPDVKFTFQGRGQKLVADTTYDLYWADLHMHALGSRGGIGIVRAGTNVVEPLLQIPDWAFEWQETYVFQKPVQLMPGDQLFVECHFDNTAPNQLVVQGQRLQPRDVNWGEGTTDEMCLGNVLAAPAL
jgi:hypothetical protein